MLSRFTRLSQATNVKHLHMSIDLSLERIRKLIARFPPYTRPTIHVTGTNGKGSVTALVGSILHQAGVKVGRFNSPHLVHVWDGILVGEEPISRERYYRTRRIVERENGTENTGEKDENTKADEENQGQKEKDRIGASLFEVLTTTALKIFEEEAVDIAIVEVGMGGRLDATNVLPDEGAVKVSAITSVDIDHARWLGSTVSEIAKEKAGIARKGVPFVVGPQKWDEVVGVVEKTAKELGALTVSSAKIIRRPQDHHIKQGEGSVAPKIPPDPEEFLYYPRDGDTAQTIQLQLPLHGEHQLENLSTALGIIECLRKLPDWSNRITPDIIAKGVRAVRWPGRLAFFNASNNEKYIELPNSYNILVDGAHNEASLRALRNYLDTILPVNTNPRAQDDPVMNPFPISYVLALSHSPPKTPEGILSALLRKGDKVEVVGFSPVEDMPWVTPVEIPEVAKVVGELVGPEGQVAVGGLTESEEPMGLNISEIERLRLLQEALQRASERSDSGLVVLTGSLYLVADLYRLVEKHPDIYRPL